MERLRAVGRHSVKFNLPKAFPAYQENGKYDVAALEDWFEADARRLAARFDARNGTKWFTHLQGYKEFLVVLRTCLAIRVKEKKPAFKRWGPATGSVEVSANGMPEELFEPLPRIFELLKGYQRLRVIVHEEQKNALLRALAPGVEISDQAWEPVPADWPGEKIASKLRKAVKKMAIESVRDIDELLALKLASQYRSEQLAIRAGKLATSSHWSRNPEISAPPDRKTAPMGDGWMMPAASSLGCEERRSYGRCLPSRSTAGR